MGYLTTWIRPIRVLSTVAANGGKYTPFTFFDNFTCLTLIVGLIFFISLNRFQNRKVRHSPQLRVDQTAIVQTIALIVHS